MFTSIFLASVGRGRKAQGGFLILLTCSGFGISLPNVDFMFLVLPMFLIAILMKVRLLTTADHSRRQSLSGEVQAPAVA